MLIAAFSILFCTYLFFGLYVLFLNYRDRLNLIFFLITLLFALISLTSIFLFKIPISSETEQILFKLEVVFYVFNLYLILIFNASLTKVSKPVWYFILILSLPVLYIIVCVSFFANYLFERENYITYFIFNKSNEYAHALQNHMSVVNLLNIFTSVFILISGYRKSASKRLRKQIIIILITFTASYLITFIDYGLIFQFSDNPDARRIPGLVVLYNLFWIFGIGYSLVKYRFLSLDTATISHDIISNIDEMVVLLNPDFHIITVNQKLKESINSEKNLYGKHISCLIHEHETIEDELKKHKTEEAISISCRINLIDQEQNRICVDSKIKMIKDKFKDIIGYLIIANELKELKHLHQIYKITCREAHVIQSVIAGRTNHEIAEELGITERTVKSHMTHIFNKLGVNNRIQLLIKLKDFNLIPEGQADKILFLREME